MLNYFFKEHLLRNCQVAHQNCVYACPTPIQEAVARAFELELKRIESPECKKYINAVLLLGVPP